MKINISMHYKLQGHAREIVRAPSSKISFNPSFGLNLASGYAFGFSFKLVLSARENVRDSERGGRFGRRRFNLVRRRTGNEPAGQPRARVNLLGITAGFEACSRLRLVLSVQMNRFFFVSVFLYSESHSDAKASPGEIPA